MRDTKTERMRRNENKEEGEKTTKRKKRVEKKTLGRRGSDSESI